MSQFQVSYEIKIGSTTYQSGRTSRLLDLKSETALNIPVNRCSLVLAAPLENAIVPADPITVSLGYNQQNTIVFTGKIHRVQWGIDQVYIEAYSQFTVLIQARFNLLYEKLTAGDIVKDIAQSRLKLAVQTIDSGLKFSSYAIGDHQTAYAQIYHLAEQCGFDWYADATDKAVFAAYKSGQAQTFTYGLDLFSYARSTQVPRVQGVEVYGESPASQGQGEDASSWFTKKEVKGSAGKSTGVVQRRFDPTLRTQAAASQVASAMLTRQTPKQHGSLKGLGNAQVKLGCSIALAELPAKAHNGTFKAIALTHRLNRQQGFCTTVYWEEP